MAYAFENLSALIRKIDWAKKPYTVEKAYLMSLFAALAYEHLPLMEIGYNWRAKVIPPLAYEEHLRQARTVNRAALQQYLQRVLQDSGLAEGEIAIEIVETIFAVYAVIKLRDIIIIAVRGSVYLYDWRINFTAGKFSLDPSRGFFHAGFYVETTKAQPELSEVLARMGVGKCGFEPKIYIAGHSLGGAITAILCGLWVNASPYHVLRNVDQDAVNVHMYVAHSAYAFGMPKFCDVEVRRRLRPVHHIRNRYDPVPSLPPARYGFVAHPENPIVLDYDWSAGDRLKASILYATSRTFGRLRVYGNHRIEKYWKRLAAQNGIEVPVAILPPDESLYSHLMP
jgi:hypothetical protein